MSIIVPTQDLAPSVASRVVTMKFADMHEGPVAEPGTVTFVLPGDLRVPADDVIIRAGAITVELDATGAGQIRLPTHDPDAIGDGVGSDWYLLVKKSWSQQVDMIRVPVGAGSISLADIAPIVEVTPAMGQWLITNATVTHAEGTQWGASVSVAGGIARFNFTFPPGGTAYWRGAIGLDFGADLDALESAVYSVMSDNLAVSLGLPGGKRGELTVARYSDQGWMIYQPGGTSKPQLWQRFRDAAGWSEWARMDVGEVEQVVEAGMQVVTNLVRDPAPTNPAQTYWAARCTLFMAGTWGRAMAAGTGATSFYAIYKSTTGAEIYNPVTPGDTITARIDVRSMPALAMGATLAFEARTWNGAAWSNLNTFATSARLDLTPGGEGVLELTGTVPAGATHVGALVRIFRAGGAHPSANDYLDWRHHVVAVNPPTQSVTYFDGDSSSAYWTGAANASQSKLVAVKTEADLSTRRTMVLDAFTGRRGGCIGTGGLPVLALRFDHHWTPFSEKVLAMLRARGLPWMQAMNPQNVGTGTDLVTWSQIQQWCLADGGEIWNHGGNHADATGEAALTEQIVGSLAMLRANLPLLAVESWAPPGLSVGGYDGYGPSNTIEAHAETFAGRLIVGHHAAVSGYVPSGIYRPLDGRVRIGQGHATIDAQTPAAVAGYLNGLPDGHGLVLMLHSNYLDQPGYMTTAQLGEVLDDIVARRDAGELLVLSHSGLNVADAGRTYRHDLLDTHAAAGDFSRSVGLSRLAGYAGGMRELIASATLSAPATVTTTIAGRARQHALAAGTHTVRHIVPIPLDATTVDVSITGATSIADAHLYAA